MEKYILELISENNRVIIPNFGAFIVSKEHGTSVLFNNFLSFNDGLLVNYIAEQKGIDTVVATEQVFEYADSLKKKLDEVGTYTIHKLGTFRKDDNGILRFQQADDVSELLGQNATVTKGAPTEINEEEESAKKVFILDEDEEQTVEASIETNEVEGEDTKDNTIVTPPAGVANENESAEKGKVQLKKTVPPPQVEQKKKKRVPALLLIAVAIIILVFGIYYLFYNKPKQPEPKVVKKAVLKPAAKKVAPSDTSHVVSNIPKPKPEPKSETKNISPGAQKGRIYIIVGGFKEADNAQKMVNRLKGEGHSNAQTFLLNNMHLVSIDSDTSYKKMEAKQQEILNNNIESWLYKVK